MDFVGTFNVNGNKNEYYLDKTIKDGVNQFFNCKRNVNDIWKFLDFILWRYQDDCDTMFEWFKQICIHKTGNIGLHSFKSIFFNATKGVCGKEIRNREPVYKCNDCAADQTCIQCVECFKSADHEGHDVRMIYARYIDTL